jgi:Flp pilus assembly protein TadD
LTEVTKTRSKSDPDPERTGAKAAPDLVTQARNRVAESPDDVEARMELAQLYRERGDVELAIEQLDAALAREADNLDLLVDRGSALAAAGRLMEAERELRRVQRVQPDQGRVHCQLGIILFKRGLYRHAEAELKRAIELDDRNGDAYFYRGEALNQLGQLDDALAMLERAVQYQPKNAKAYYTMGILYDRKHLRQEADTMYRKAWDVGAA